MLKRTWKTVSDLDTWLSLWSRLPKDGTAWAVAFMVAIAAWAWGLIRGIDPWFLVVGTLLLWPATVWTVSQFMRIPAWLDSRRGDPLFLEQQGKEMNVALHRQGGHDASMSAASPMGVKLHNLRTRPLKLRAVRVLSTVVFGNTITFNSPIAQVTFNNDAFGNWFNNESLAMSWGAADRNNVRSLKGLPVTIVRGQPLTLPMLWITTVDISAAIKLFEQCDGRAVWDTRFEFVTPKGGVISKSAQCTINMQAPEPTPSTLSTGDSSNE